MRKVYFTNDTAIVFKRIYAGLHNGLHFIGEEKNVASDEITECDDYNIYTTTIGSLTDEEYTAVLNEGRDFYTEQIMMVRNPCLKIETLYELADYLNTEDANKYDVDDIISFNNWDADDNGCYDGEHKLTFSEDEGKYIVTER